VSGGMVGKMNLVSLATAMLGPITAELGRVSTSLMDAHPHFPAVCVDDVAYLLRLLDALEEVLGSGIASIHPRLAREAEEAAAESSMLLRNAQCNLAFVLQLVEEFCVRGDIGSPPHDMNVRFLAEVVARLNDVRFDLVAGMGLADGLAGQ